MKKILKIILPIIILAAFCSLVYAATEQLDQDNPNHSDGWHEVKDKKWQAQSFVAGLTGKLTKVALYLKKEKSPGELTIEIRNTVGPDYHPGSTVYASLTTSAVVSTTGQEYEFSFPSPAAVTAGTHYSIVLHEPAGGDKGKYKWAEYKPSDIYPEGNAWHSDNSGGSWEVGGGGIHDLYFRTYVTITVSNNPPNAFNLILPASGTEVATTPTLDWADSSDPDAGDTVTYTLLIDNNSDFSSPTVTKTGLASSTYTVTAGDGLSDHTYYYWKVKAADNHGAETWSNQTNWYFITNNANGSPNTFNLLTPTNGASVSPTPTLDWEDAADSDPGDTVTYTLWVDNNSDFSSPMVAKTGLTSSTYTITMEDELSMDTVYYWKVKAVDKHGAERWSNQTDWSFTVSALPPADTIPPAAITDLAAQPGPAEGSVLLTWTAPGDDGNVGTATSYILKYSTLPILTQGQFEMATTYNQSWIPQPAGAKESYTLTGLPPATTLWFAIETLDEVGNQSSLSNSPSAAVGEGSLEIIGFPLVSPSPFNPDQESTNIQYTLSRDANVTIYMFNTLGELIWQSSYLAGTLGGSAGLNKVGWSGITEFYGVAAEGTYLFRIMARTDGETRLLAKGKIIVLK